MSFLELAPSVARLGKLALYTLLLVLPGGSLGLLLLWWLNYRRRRPQSRRVPFRGWVWDPSARAPYGLSVRPQFHRAAQGRE
jgi:hypothetical protein